MYIHFCSHMFVVFSPLVVPEVPSLRFAALLEQPEPRNANRESSGLGFRV